MEEAQRPPKEMGLCLPSVRDMATQMRIEHLINNVNKEMEWGYLAYSHTLRILTQFNH
jgi:ABC-type dipeptide/oligopeptide/nickel transport system ATPase subunit